MPNGRDVSRPQSRWELMVWGAASVFFVISTAASWQRWANFEYRTFDLAYYIQAVWQLIHGRFEVTIENVPLLGNHVEPIVFLFVPILAIVRHPMMFVVVQNAALAGTAPIGYRLARAYFNQTKALLLSVALLLSPAAGYVALHEFHPEALTTPLLLLMVYSRAIRRIWLHWLCFMAVLACKENMALLLIAYCTVFLIIERRRSLAESFRWYAAPCLVAAVWFVVCIKVITPAFNSGNIDYLSLYDRLGKNAFDILWNAFTKPQVAGGALVQALTQGNLVWGLLLPFCALPLLRPRWLLISAPIFLQHLLSWRSSEWSIYFHYGAPLLPLMWIAAVEGLASLRDRGRTSPIFLAIIIGLLVLTCGAMQLALGPAPAVGAELLNHANRSADRDRKEAFIAKISAGASVVAPLPYLSHLAMREKLYSLHYILKGLKTLSRSRYQPPAPTDFVLIDYGDTATFDASAGYYHPQMKTADGTVIPSSDRLLHDFLKGTAWTSESIDQITLFKRTGNNDFGGNRQQGAAADTTSLFSGAGNELLGIQRFRPDARSKELELELLWSVRSARETFPWMILRLTDPTRHSEPSRTRGFCAIQAGEGLVTDRWRTDLSDLPPGEYTAEAIFIDNSKRVWLETHGGGDPRSTVLGNPVPLGRITIPRLSR